MYMFGIGKFGKITTSKMRLRTRSRSSILLLCVSVTLLGYMGMPRYDDYERISSPEKPLEIPWTQRRQNLLSKRGASKVFMFSYMRGGSSIGGELFDLDPKAVLWYEPLDAFYSAIYGTVFEQIPGNIHYDKNITRMVTEPSVMKELLNLFKNTLEGRYERLPVEAMAHHFLQQVTAMDQFTQCYRKSPQKAPIKQCKSALFGLCGPKPIESRQSGCHIAIDAAKQVLMGNITSMDEAALIRQMAQLLEASKTERLVSEKVFRSAGVFLKYHRCLRDVTLAVRICLPKAVARYKSSDLQVLEVNRMKMEDMDPVLDSIPDLHVIYYSRDPRAIALSRVSTRGLMWDKMDRRPIREAQMLCPKMAEDVRYLRHLEAKYPSAILRVRYEDYVHHPMVEAGRMYAHINRTVPAAWGKFVEKHFGVSNGMGTGNFGTRVKNVTETALKWKTKIPEDQLLQIDKLCFDVIKELGYPLYSELR